MAEETETIDGGKPVVANEEKSKKKIKMSENGMPIMDAVDIALLKEITGQKEQIYRHLGMLSEAEHQALKEIEKIEDKRQKLALEIKDKYDLPGDKLWQLNPQTSEIIVQEDSFQPPQ